MSESGSGVKPEPTQPRLRLGCARCAEGTNEPSDEGYERVRGLEGRRGEGDGRGSELRTAEGGGGDEEEAEAEEGGCRQFLQRRLFASLTDGLRSGPCPPAATTPPPPPPLPQSSWSLTPFLGRAHLRFTTRLTSCTRFTYNCLFTRMHFISSSRKQEQEADADGNGGGFTSSVPYLGPLVADIFHRTFCAEANNPY